MKKIIILCFAATAACVCFADGYKYTPPIFIPTVQDNRICLITNEAKEFSGDSYAVVEIDGKREKIRFDSQSINEQTTDKDITVKTISCIRSNIQLILTMKILWIERAFTLQTKIINRGNKNIRLQEMVLFDTDSGGFIKFKSSNCLVTPLLNSNDARMIKEIENENFGEVAGIYYGDEGFLIGPVGSPSAYNRIEVFKKQNAVNLKITAEMDGVLVEPLESRQSDEIVFIFKRPETAIEMWTTKAAEGYKARTDKGSMSGWCSWYDRTTQIDEKHMIDVIDTQSKNSNILNLRLIQLDDGYQVMDGTWTANAKFPSGLKALVDKIHESSALAGKWMAPLMIDPNHPWVKQHGGNLQKGSEGIQAFQNPNPFHPAGAYWINPSCSESKKFLAKIIKDSVQEEGFDYLKLDFNGIGSQFCDPKKTRLEVFRDLYDLYRQNAGEKTYILACLGCPNRGVIGYADAARIGPDSHPHHFLNCLKSVLRFQIFHNKWWATDPDVTYISGELKSRMLGGVKGGDAAWKTWHSVVGLTCGATMISEPINSDDSREFWRNWEILNPPAKENTKAIDLCYEKTISRFGFTSQKKYGCFGVYCLLNIEDTPRSVRLDLVNAGLDEKKTYAVYSFWDHRLKTIVQETYLSDILESGHSELLRFTEIDTESKIPRIIGSNFHISCGAAEISDVKADLNGITITMNDSGARDGSLLIYSRKNLAIEQADGCSKAELKKIGENIYELAIKNRLRNKANSVKIKAL